MLGRYLLLIGGADGQRSHLAAIAHNDATLTIVFETPHLTLLADATLPTIIERGRGALLGMTFSTGCDQPAATLDPGTWDRIIASTGHHLIDQYWGGYIAVIASPHDTIVDVVRAPFGWLPCFHCKSGLLAACASDITLLTTLGLALPALDPDALARHLLLPDIRRSDTALKGIDELRGGDRWRFARERRTTSLWSPWTFAGPDRQITDFVEARSRLREAAHYCVRARSSAEHRTLLMMSGGLDSSIVAACLHAAQRDIYGLTFVTTNPSGDERGAAQPVADHLAFPLAAKRLRVEDTDPFRSASAHLPRPIARGFEQGIGTLAKTAAAESGATKIVNGGAGDHIFCAIQSPAPVADCLLVKGGRSHFWSTARTLAELAPSSVRTVAWRGWRRALSKRPYQRPPDVTLLSAAVLDQIEAAAAHPWLRAPREIPPGKSVHVGLLAPAQGVAEDFDPRASLPSEAILISQPLVEICLRIPSWMWFDRGHNRAAARHAFSADLPPGTIWRRSKGTPDSYLVELFEARRPAIRTALSDGILAALGLLDIAAIHMLLDDPRPPHDLTFVRIMTLLDVEAWARTWPL